MSKQSGGRGTSMKSWFDANPKALKRTEDFVALRLKGDPTSVRSLLDGLNIQSKFPFTSEPSLIRHLKTLGLTTSTPRQNAATATGASEKNQLFVPSPKRSKAIKAARRWVITAAQNNTEPHAGFLDTLNVYCRANNAELLIRPLRYKNATVEGNIPDGVDPEGTWWHPSVEKHLIDVEIELKDVVIPDVRIAATSGNPLMGLDSRSGTKHGIYAATQLSMRTVPTPQQVLPKILYSTGAVTIANYSTTKSGNLAGFHHNLSAIVVEQDKKGRTFLRAIQWDGEGLTDIDKRYTPKGQRKADRWEALIPGDEHAWFVDPSVKAATYTNRNSMAKTGRPHVIVRHDLLDCYSVSHHHLGNQLTQTNKDVHGWGNLEKELNDTIDFLNETSPRGALNLIVSSNHNDHLSQWLSKGEKAVTAQNALMYHKLMAAVLESSERTPTGVKHANPFEVYAEGRVTAQTEFLGGDDCYMIQGIDVAMHGHRGPNGSRGSARNLANIGVKSVIGHSHSPNIFRGVHQVGTSSCYDLEYASGPSSWLHCHAVIHSNGKRQLLPIIDGEWRARD